MSQHNHVLSTLLLPHTNNLGPMVVLGHRLGASNPCCKFSNLPGSAYLCPRCVCLYRGFFVSHPIERRAPLPHSIVARERKRYMMAEKVWSNNTFAHLREAIAQLLTKHVNVFFLYDQLEGPLSDFFKTSSTF